MKVMKVCGRQDRAVPATSPAGIAGLPASRQRAGQRQRADSILRPCVLRSCGCNLIYSVYVFLSFLFQSSVFVDSLDLIQVVSTVLQTS